MASGCPRQFPGSPTCLGEIAELQGANVVLGGAEVLEGEPCGTIAISAEAEIQRLRRLGRVGLCHSGRRTGILYSGVDDCLSLLAGCQDVIAIVCNNRIMLRVVVALGCVYFKAPLRDDDR